MERATLLHELNQAYDHIHALLSTIPDRALDWQPDPKEWSLRRTISHLAHANDFYVMIIEEARRNQFGSVVLTDKLDGRKRMELTDREIEAAPTMRAVLERLQEAYQRLLSTLESLSPQELERPFSIAERADTRTTTLRERVYLSATAHFYEHEQQLLNTLAAWKVAFQ